MKKIWTKFIRFWYFNISNPVIRKGETEAFRWVFRRFFLTVETRSGNWRARWTASEYPFGYLLSSKTDDNIIGFCQTVYMVGMLLTSDQGFVNDIQKAISKYEKRLGKAELEQDGEEAAIAEVKAVQDYVDAPKKVQRKMERDANGRFKKAVKEVQKNES